MRCAPLLPVVGSTPCKPCCHVECLQWQHPGARWPHNSAPTPVRHRICTPPPAGTASAKSTELTTTAWITTRLELPPYCCTFQTWRREVGGVGLPAEAAVVGAVQPQNAVAAGQRRWLRKGADLRRTACCPVSTEAVTSFDRCHACNPSSCTAFDSSLLILLPKHLFSGETAFPSASPLVVFSSF